MKVIHARNVNEAYAIGLNYLEEVGYVENSRAGKVLVAPEPVTTTYTHPRERVLFNKERNANPFFHLMESFWMLAGCNDVAWITQFNKSFEQFSDDGKTFHGAYGFRWRYWPQDEHTRDQLAECCRLLRNNPKDRRVYLNMWNPAMDLGEIGKDFPCNVGIHFQVRPTGRLDMTVFNRSNDIIWGAYGANAVHMSMLHEYVCLSTGIPMGYYHQVSDNYHAYVDVLKKVGRPDPHPMCPYENGQVRVMPLLNEDETFEMLQSDIFNLVSYRLEDPVFQFDTRFFQEVIHPLLNAWVLFKNKKVPQAHFEAQSITATDWRKVCTQWLNKKLVK